MSDIQRYKMELDSKNGLVHFNHKEDGFWVKYDDHMTICMEQEKELMKAEKRIDELEKVNKYMEQILLSIANRSANKLETEQ